jgi:hypothetical protein
VHAGGGQLAREYKLIKPSHVAMAAPAIQQEPSATANAQPTCWRCSITWGIQSCRALGLSRELVICCILTVVSPTREYQRRLRERESRAAELEKMHIRLGNSRVLLFVIAVLMVWEVFHAHAFSARWLALPLAGFVAVAAYHARVLRARDLALRAVLFYRQGLARLEDRWAGTGQTGERFADPHHVYAADLDLFGKGSLFELVSTARTRAGEETLAQWLLGPSPLDQIRDRHAAVSELREALDFREDLAVLGEDAGVGVHPEALALWAEAPNQMQYGWLRWLASLLGIFAVAGLVLWGYRGNAAPLVAVLAIEAILRYRLRKPIQKVLHGAEHAFHDLELLAGVLARTERQTFQSPRLQALQEALRSNGSTASVAIARLSTIVDLSESQHNMLVAALDVPLMYSVQVALAAERWRQAHGSAVRVWLRVLGEIEAVLALTSYGYEHPADPFPKFARSGTCFEAEALGHPLLPLNACVRNDVKLSDDVRALLVSGSNMSGKSTLLRAVGINAVLAMAGAPVRASHLRMTPLRVGASIRINDSLREGNSRFYAEITRLRRLFDLAGGDPPLLFLLDELLQGTNSKDRRIGAEVLLRALVNRRAIGLVSTHDLALTEIDAPANGHLQNVHFQDTFADGKMVFDYKLRPGVVARSNGLELMRSIGLDV